MGQELLTVKEVAALLRVPTSWIYARTSEGGGLEAIPYLKLGRHLRFRRLEIEEWLEKQHGNGSKTSGTLPEGSPQPVTVQ